MIHQKEPEQLTIPPNGLPESEQPTWRHDFPIDWPQDDYVARRDFTKFLVLTSFAFTVGQFWIVVQNYFRMQGGRPPIREVATVDDIPVGGALSFRYPREHDDCLLVRTGQNDFIAYSQKCTHLSCPVKASIETNSLHCPCHEGSFDMATGRPTGGPPRRPLPVVNLEIRGGRIYATGITERTT
jgi:nitrite reductase/ring-hydroxylating ferredoxin subunit